jgi:hypothetical protein
MARPAFERVDMTRSPKDTVTRVYGLTFEGFKLEVKP